MSLALLLIHNRNHLILFWFSRICFDTAYSWKLKTEIWKYCSKIIFKRVNSIVKSIFNENFTKKEVYGSREQCTGLIDKRKHEMQALKMLSKLYLSVRLWIEFSTFAFLAGSHNTVHDPAKNTKTCIPMRFWILRHYLHF